MTNVHIDHADEMFAKGLILVGEHYYDGKLLRLDFHDPATTCLHRMRPQSTPDLTILPMNGKPGYTRRDVNHGFCLLDKDHKGRHSTVVFWCDVCGKARRGEPYRSDEDVAICFMCQVVDYEQREGYR